MRSCGTCLCCQPEKTLESSNRDQEQYRKEQRNVPKTDSAHDREVTGQPDHAGAHMLGGRNTLDLWGEVHPLVLGVQVGTLRDDKSILDRSVERREFMNVDVVKVLPPTNLRGRAQLLLKVEFAEIKSDHGCAVFDR